jgi:hypothetical protein
MKRSTKLGPDGQPFCRCTHARSSHVLDVPRGWRECLDRLVPIRALGMRSTTLCGCERYSPRG